MYTLISGRLRRGRDIYDYTGIYTKRAGGVDWKAIVRHEHAVARPSGVIDDGLNDVEIEEVIRQLVDDSLSEALLARPNAATA